jgi:hypothetical protein
MCEHRKKERKKQGVYQCIFSIHHMDSYGHTCMYAHRLASNCCVSTVKGRKMRAWDSHMQFEVCQLSFIRAAGERRFRPAQQDGSPLECHALQAGQGKRSCRFVGKHGTALAGVRALGDGALYGLATLGLEKLDQIIFSHPTVQVGDGQLLQRAQGGVDLSKAT